MGDLLCVGLILNFLSIPYPLLSRLLGDVDVARQVPGHLHCQSAIIDGEAIIQDENGDLLRCAGIGIGHLRMDTDVTCWRWRYHPFILDRGRNSGAVVGTGDVFLLRSCLLGCSC